MNDLIQQIRALKDKKPRSFTKDEVINIKKYYVLTGSKLRTCRKFDINKAELKSVLDNLAGD